MLHVNFPRVGGGDLQHSPANKIASRSTGELLKRTIATDVTTERIFEKYRVRYHFQQLLRETQLVP